MAISEFFTETIMNSGLNRVLSIVALGLVGAGVECYHEKNGEKKAVSAIVGVTKYAEIGAIGITAYRIYKDFNMYESGISALCGVAGAYLFYNFYAKLQQGTTKKLVSDGCSVVMGVAFGMSLAYFVISRMDKEVLSR